MRSFDRFRYFLAQFREKLGNYAISGKPLAVLRFEELFSNDALGSMKKYPGRAKPFCIPVAS